METAQPCKGAKRSGAPVQKCKGERQRFRWRVAGDGHGHLEFRNRPFGHRELAPGFRRLKAEGLTPERLTTEAVTRHRE